jgi:hypothetical protein
MNTTDVAKFPESYVDDNPSGRYYNATRPWGLPESDPAVIPVVICVSAIILFCLLCSVPMLDSCRSNRHLPNGSSRQGQEDQPQQQEEECCSKEQKEARAKIIEAYILQESIVSLDLT